MRSRLALLSTAAVFAVALAGPAYTAEESPTKVPGTSTDGSSSNQNPGNIVAPEKDSSMSGAKDGSQSGGTSTDQSATNVPGASAEGDPSTENPGSLSAPEKDPASAGQAVKGGPTDSSAANVPGTDAEGDPKTENQGALSAPEADKSKM
jgi:hypothetical protein